MNVGEHVAWDAPHWKHGIATGEIIDSTDNIPMYRVRLPHGGIADVRKEKCRPATTDERLLAIANFTT